MTPGRPAGPSPARIRPARRARGPLRRVLPRARRFLGARKRVLVTLGGWSLLESAHTFLGGYGVAQALDRGFLDGDPGTGLAWLAVAAVAIVVGGLANRGVFRGLADLVEPLRDGLLRRVVGTALRDAVADPARSGDSAVVSRLTHQTETARDSFAGLVLVARSFLFTSAGALAGLAALAPLLLVVVLPPLLLGLALFLATLLPMAARQQDYLRADEDLAEAYGAVATGLRDVVACGAEDRAEDRTGRLADAEVRAARSLARWAAARTLSLGVAGQLPVLLLVLATPWLLRGGVTAGELLGALTYLTQSLLPALQTLMTALGAAGTRLLVILDRLMGGADEERTGPAAAPRGPADPAVAPPGHPLPEVPPSSARPSSDPPPSDPPPSDLPSPGPASPAPADPEPALREPASGEPAPREPARRGSAPREPALAPRGAALTSPGRAPGRSGSPRTPVRPAFAPVPPAPSVPFAPSA
ncbi:ABC transporter ATP-binding protein, partial [Streptomyces sp. NPDC048845]|uniref:ABC transporter ATP-binding protein n=1 Tax=Streptomyces sp. NPDC048845 TaxID=3155390 RepID=UPI00341FA04D